MVAFSIFTQLATAMLLFAASSEAAPKKAHATSSAAAVEATGFTSPSSQIKTDLTSSCHVEGTAGDMRERHSTSQPSFIGCQNECFFDSPCQTYSYNPTTEVCITYMSAIDITTGSTGTFFSSKRPEDGSNFCFGSEGY